MTIFECLSKIEVGSAENNKCQFNGYLEDFLMSDKYSVNNDLKKAFDYLLEVNPSFKICVGLILDINNTVISNRIIRYKDAFKISKNALFYPFIVYGKNNKGEDCATILLEKDDTSFIKAKGLYYCFSEPNSLYEKHRNEIISICDQYIPTLKALFVDNERASLVQRNYDRSYFKDYEEYKTMAFDVAIKLKENCKTAISMVSETDKEQAIKDYVVVWFFIKKTVYVLYMMNKGILKTLHNDDIKVQRSVAKSNADSVPFLSYYEMWRL